MSWKTIILSIAVLGLSVPATAAVTAPVITKGSKVTIHYTIKVDDEVVGSTLNSEPYQYVQGSENMLIGVQKRLEGLKKGDSRLLLIPPEEGFGLVHPEQIQEVPKANMPKGDVKAGDFVVLTAPDGHEERVPVMEVRKDTLLLDFNHPLAGKTLAIDVTIVDVA